MKSCQICIALKPDGECSIYSRIPPVTFVARCKHYIQAAEYIPPPVEVVVSKRECATCEQNNDGWCLRLDHPDFQYNFVKIREGMECS